jgi:hypothetical protein
MLIALDHERCEPWGSRHGQAFAAFTLQHPNAYTSSLDRAWAALHRIYIVGDAPKRVFDALRALILAPRQARVSGTATEPGRPRQFDSSVHPAVVDSPNTRKRQTPLLFKSPFRVRWQMKAKVQLALSLLLVTGCAPLVTARPAPHCTMQFLYTEWYTDGGMLEPRPVKGCAPASQPEVAREPVSR